MCEGALEVHASWSVTGSVVGRSEEADKQKEAFGRRMMVMMRREGGCGTHRM